MRNNGLWILCINLTPLVNFAIFHFLSTIASICNYLQRLLFKSWRSESYLSLESIFIKSLWKVLNPTKAKALLFLFAIEMLTSFPKNSVWNVASCTCPLKNPSNKSKPQAVSAKRKQKQNLNFKCMCECLSIIREHHFDVLGEVMHSLNARIFLLLLIKWLKMVCHQYLILASHFWAVSFLFREKASLPWVFQWGLLGSWFSELLCPVCQDGVASFSLLCPAFSPGVRRLFISSTSPRSRLTLISAWHWNLLLFMTA